MTQRIFVYGTLKRGCHNHGYLAGQRFLGEARTAPGFRLFDLGGYPGIVVWPDDTAGVTGEIWEVDAPALAALDELEGLAIGIYRREAIPLLSPYADQGIQAYTYAHAITGRREVGSTWTE